MHKIFYIKDADFPQFVNSMIAKHQVIAPQAQKQKFIFDQIRSDEELRLDYDVTILPPKKAIFPPKQNLVEFDGEKVKSSINPVHQILFGVHFYDIKAIDMLDILFEDGIMDWDYHANRQYTTIVGSCIQNVSERSFFGSVGRHVFPKGHDAFLTKLKNGYTFEVRTSKGDKLLNYGNFVEATQRQIDDADRIGHEITKKCPQKLEYAGEHIARQVRATYKKNKIWQDMSQKCLACGTCNIVCPTCYCFDVQDEWELNQVAAKRYRVWDGCMLEDFSKVSLGNDMHEDFRSRIHSRFRHRVMRKTTYLNDKLDGPACVGCGRCSEGCVPDIADPVDIIHTIMKD